MQKEHALKIASKLLIEPVIEARYFIRNDNDLYSAVYWLWCANILWDEICKNNMFDLSIDEVSKAYKIMVNQEETDFFKDGEYFEDPRNEKIKELLVHVNKNDVWASYPEADEIQNAFFDDSQLMLEKFVQFESADMDYNRQPWNTKKIPNEILALEKEGLLTRTVDGRHWMFMNKQGSWKDNAKEALNKYKYILPKEKVLRKYVVQQDGSAYAERAIYKIIKDVHK